MSPGRAVTAPHGLTVLAAALAVAPSPAAATSAEVAALLARGDAAAAAFDLNAAGAAYRAALRVAPDDYDANWKLARTLTDQATLAQRRDEQERLCGEAEAAARKAVAVRPADARGHDYLAIAVGKLALFEGGKRKVELSRLVKSEAEKALQCDPNDDLALHVLGIWNREVAQLNWALRAFAQLLYGGLPSASLDVAIADLKRATELRPEVIPHHVELGITLEDAGRWAAAKAQFDEALTLPTGWVTDDYYRALARRHLAGLASHLR